MGGMYTAGCPIHRALCDGWDAGCPIFAAVSSRLRWGRTTPGTPSIPCRVPHPSQLHRDGWDAYPTHRHSPTSCHSERSEESPHWPLPLPVLRRCLFYAVILSGAARVLCELRSRRTPIPLAPAPTAHPFFPKIPPSTLLFVLPPFFDLSFCSASCLSFRSASGVPGERSLLAGVEQRGNLLLPLPLPLPFRREQEASPPGITIIESRGFSPGSFLVSLSPEGYAFTRAVSRPLLLLRVLDRASDRGHENNSRKNPSKSPCQAPRPTKIDSTTRKQKRKNLPASGIVVMLQVV
jgi:hypothetical protein